MMEISSENIDEKNIVSKLRVYRSLHASISLMAQSLFRELFFLFLEDCQEIVFSRWDDLINCSSFCVHLSLLEWAMTSRERIVSNMNLASFRGYVLAVLVSDFFSKLCFERKKLYQRTNYNEKIYFWLIKMSIDRKKENDENENWRSCRCFGGWRKKISEAWVMKQTPKALRFDQHILFLSWILVIYVADRL